MSDTPWTPGPWEDQGYRTKGADGSVVSIMSRPADARLIAAAPEMAELLERVADLLEQEAIAFHEQEQAHALLARIRGEA